MTVIILTSGTSWNVPADWSNTNQIETWGGGGSGGGGFGSAGGGGGGGGYASISNRTGLSGTITIAIGAGGLHDSGDQNGNPGGATSFNTGPDVASNGGSGGLDDVLGGGAGGAGTTGTTLHTGGAGANGDPVNFLAGGGGGGAAGPAGNGVAGTQGAIGGGGNGGAGNNGSGGAGGTGGTGAGGNGVANSNGGGGGAGGAQADIGGNGALPGGGGGGGGSGPQADAGDGGGGQIRLTYTPAASNITPSITELPPLTHYRQLRGARDSDRWEFNGWQRSPTSPDSLMAFPLYHTEVPPGKKWVKWDFKWEQAPLSANAPPLVEATWFDVPPRGTWNAARYQDWQRGVIPLEYLVPPPSTDVPRGRYNNSRYQDWQEAPQPNSIAPPPVAPWTALPPTSWDRRIQYQGVQLAPQPQIMSPPLPVYDVPRGTFNVARYQDHLQSYQRLEYVVPPPQVDVPRGVRKFDYSGWQKMGANPDVGPPLQSSVSTSLPPPGRLQLHPYDFSGASAGPRPGNVIPAIQRTFLPLVGVGSYGP